MTRFLAPDTACPAGPTDVSNGTEWAAAVTQFNAVTDSPCVFEIKITQNVVVNNGNAIINNPTPGIELHIDGTEPLVAQTSFTLSGGDTYVPILIAQNSRVTLENLVVASGRGGTIFPIDGNGGCIYNAGALTLLNSQVTNCQLQFSGSDPDNGNNGAGIYNSGSLTLINASIYNNRAGQAALARGNGGGIYNTAGATLTATNSTISGNYAGNKGGGIWSAGTASLTHTTVTRNVRLAGSGSGVYVNGGTLNLTNSLVAGQAENDPPTGKEDCAVSAAGTITSNDYNLDSDNTCNLTAAHDLPGNGSSNLDPVLQTNGGWTPNHALLTGSAAINQIPIVNGSCNGSGVVADQRAAPRPQPAGGACDMGAYEAQSVLAVTLESFSANSQAEHVLVTWETASELGNTGFNLYRTGSADPPTGADLLTFAPSQGPDSAQGFAYSHQDFAVTAGQTYWYWLEDVDISGAATMHGPASVLFADPTAVALTVLHASSLPAQTMTGLWWVALAALAVIGLVAAIPGMRRSFQRDGK
jgi:hypothetical protein